MSREQFVIARLTEWSTRNEWAAQIAKTKLRELEAKSTSDVIRRKVPQVDRRAA